MAAILLPKDTETESNDAFFPINGISELKNEMIVRNNNKYYLVRNGEMIELPLSGPPIK